MQMVRCSLWLIAHILHNMPIICLVIMPFLKIKSYHVVVPVGPIARKNFIVLREIIV